MWLVLAGLCLFGFLVASELVVVPVGFYSTLAAIAILAVIGVGLSAVLLFLDKRKKGPP